LKTKLLRKGTIEILEEVEKNDSIFDEKETFMLIVLICKAMELG